MVISQNSDTQLLPYEVVTSSCWASSQFTNPFSVLCDNFFCQGFLEKQESLVHGGSGPEAHWRPAESEQCHLLPHCPELMATPALCCSQPGMQWLTTFRWHNRPAELAQCKEEWGDTQNEGE